MESENGVRKWSQTLSYTHGLDALSWVGCHQCTALRYLTNASPGNATRRIAGMSGRASGEPLAAAGAHGVWWVADCDQSARNAMRALAHGRPVPAAPATRESASESSVCHSLWR